MIPLNDWDAVLANPAQPAPIVGGGGYYPCSPPMATDPLAERVDWVIRVLSVVALGVTVLEIVRGK